MTRENIEIAGWPAGEEPRRSWKMSDWHREWTRRHLDRSGFHPEGRVPKSDYNLHHLDLDPPADAEAEFVQRQREILHADHDTGLRLRDEPELPSRVLGSVFTAALGDAMGARVAFVGAEALRRQDGGRWFTEPVFPHGIAQVSPNTQLMLFTMESLIGPHIVNRTTPGDPIWANPIMQVCLGYRRWAFTQGHHPDRLYGTLPAKMRFTGWLMRDRDMFDRRSEDDSLASTLIAQAADGSFAGHATCEGADCVPRTLPLALWTESPGEAFRIGTDSARHTHGRPEDHFAAGAFAVLLQQVLLGEPLARAITVAREQLDAAPDARATAEAIDAAVELARTVTAPAPPQQITATFGGVTTGAQALGAALYAIIVTDYVRETLSVATNHDGDAAATGMLAGALAGARWGIETVPRALLSRLDLYQVVEVLARDLLAEFGPQPPTDPLWIRRYWHD